MLFELAARHCAIQGSHFFACHIDHGIRGEEAARDREFCIRLARECPQCADIFVLCADVPALAKDSGLSIEHQARNVRYDFFAKTMKENSIPILVTAHNADDNLETLVFNLARGSGPRGMRGIPKHRPFADGILIRPMLGISKSEVLEFCRDNGLDFVTDSTNSDTDYTRNLIRASIVPRLEAINPSVRDSAARLSSSMSELCALIDGAAEAFIPKDGCLSVKVLNSASPHLLPSILSLAAEQAGIDLEAVHVESLCKLCREARDASSVSLPGSTRAVIYGDSLCFELDKKSRDIPTPFDIPLSDGKHNIPGGSLNVKWHDDGVEISLFLLPNREKCVNDKNVYKLDINAYIIFDTIMNNASALHMRNRVAGDRILSGGMHKNVKKLMCDKKLTKAVRDVIPMLCLGDEILWIPGTAASDFIKCRYL